MLLEGAGPLQWGQLAQDNGTYNRRMPEFHQWRDKLFRCSSMGLRDSSQMICIVVQRVHGGKGPALAMQNNNDKEVVITK